ncbi:glycerol kinase [Rhodobacterales bacterium]|nr:glycerol kinase [Rhodobacterales bacterium]
MRVAAIDQGTTSTRCLVIENNASWRVAGSLRHAQRHPGPGHVEHDPEELLGNIRKLLSQAGSVDAIAIANQGESCLAWDAETGDALSPVIVWQDARTAAALKSLGADAEALSRQISGLPLDAYFSASKFTWMLKNIPAVATAHANGRLRLGTTDAFFLDRLTGRFATDAATASRTGMMNLATEEWSPDLCALHGVPMDCLPEILAVDETFGEYGDVPVRASIVDQQAALYGHGCRRSGDCKITFGTGAFLLCVSDGRPSDTADLLPTIAWRKRETETAHAVEAGVYDAGAALEWAARIGLYSSVEDLEALEGPSALSKGLIFVPALSGLAAPYWDRDAAPLFIGMDHATDRLDMVRSVLEGIALLTATLIERTAAVTRVSETISIDGGLSRNRYFAQFLASASNRTICVPPMHELTALGLAELCGIDASPARSNAAVFRPDGSVTDAERTRFAQAVERSRDWHSARP